MTNKLFALIFFCSLGLSAAGQGGYSIKGIAIDTSSKIRMTNTTVCILNAKDSILRKFTYAGENGVFSISGLPAGKFILLMSYKDYADYVEPFTLDAAHPTVNFGQVSMRLKSKILQEVMIKGQVTAIKIKGDTTEFNAKAYVIQPNDKVEDLLRQLPGMQVDKDGKITANGQAVNKVLVDGEEFFGDDPTLVTKNIRADMVDKVQLYDKKSDQAAFTGIDDGVKTKTINIKLKEDKKNGTFGKLTGGVGTNDYYEGQAIYNRFKAHEKYSAYFTIANDGKTGLNFGDANSIGATGGNIQLIDGGIMITSTGGNDALDSFNGTYNGRGLPQSQNGGVHYDGKWNADKESINANYKIGALDVDGTTTTLTQQNLLTGTINSNAAQVFNNHAFRQKLDAAYTLAIDTATNLKVTADGTQKNFNVDNSYQTTTTGATNNLINVQKRQVTNNGDQQIFNASAFYTKKFKKPRRTFSWTVSEGYNNNETKGYLNSATDFYTAGVKDSTQNINQYKTSNTLSSVFNSNMTYTEPLSKTLSLVFNYGLGINNTTQDTKSFDQSAQGIYNILDTKYSNDYKFNQFTNQVGAIFNYKKNKITFNFGTKASDVAFKQVDENTGIVYRRDFINWAPQANFQYRISQQSGFTINYNGSTTQPTISQIQPVATNTDPQNITVGNANLKPSFTNNLYFNYNLFKPVSGFNMFLYGSFSFTSDQIVNNTSTDITTAKTTTQYVNITGSTPYNYYLAADLGKQRLTSLEINAGLSFSTNASIGYSFVNGALNESRTHTYSGAFSVSKYVAKKYQWNFNAGPSYTINEFSLSSANNNNAAGFNTNGRAAYYLPAKFILSSDINYNYTAKTEVFPAQYKTIWNASLAKTFLKDDKLKLAVAANDMLDQNINFSRGVSGNAITQTNTNGIRRYFMFTVSWDFTKFGTSTAKN